MRALKGSPCGRLSGQFVGADAYIRPQNNGTMRASAPTMQSVALRGPRLEDSPQGEALKLLSQWIWDKIP